VILGCHIAGERAVEIVQVVAVAIASELRVDDLAKMPLSFPTYTGILGLAAFRAARQIHPDDGSRMPQLEESMQAGKPA
jgi:hypothetical protein